jgi:hypothetical protein
MATGRFTTPQASIQLGTGNTTLYQVPSGYYSVFSVSLTNVTSSAVTIQLALATSGSPGTSDWIEFGTVIQPKGVFERTGLVLGPSQYVVALASAGTAVNATVYGIETSTS